MSPSYQFLVPHTDYGVNSAMKLGSQSFQSLFKVMQSWEILLSEKLGNDASAVERYQVPGMRQCQFEERQR